jgi:hypothetical protein
VVFLWRCYARAGASAIGVAAGPGSGNEHVVAGRYAVCGRVQHAELRLEARLICVRVLSSDASEAVSQLRIDDAFVADHTGAGSTWKSQAVSGPEAQSIPRIATTRSQIADIYV